MLGAGHLIEDILRFGPSEIYWCFLYECLVSNFHKIPTNGKEIEVTYIQYFSRQLFNKGQLQLQIDGHGLLGEERSIFFVHKHLIVPEGIIHDCTHDISCHEWHESCILEVPTIQKAFEIWNVLKKHSCNACSRMVSKKGILI